MLWFIAANDLALIIAIAIHRRCGADRPPVATILPVRHRETRDTRGGVAWTIFLPQFSPVSLCVDWWAH
jgi:hypothetical protein